MAAAVVLIGYSGHAWVVADCLVAAGYALAGYCDRAPVAHNPYDLSFLGTETDVATLVRLRTHGWFVSIGDNAVRARVQAALRTALGTAPVVARHPSAIVSAPRVRSDTLVGITMLARSST